MKIASLYYSDDGIVRMTIHGDLTAEILERLRGDIREATTYIGSLYKEHGDLRGVLDLSHCTSYHPEVLVILGEFASNIKEYFDRAATYGAQGPIALARDVVLGLARWKELRSFETERDALAWLRGTTSRP